MKWITWSVIVATVIAITWVSQSVTPPEAPDDLVGVWRTSEPEYEDRFFEIKKDRIILGTGGVSSSSHAITSLEAIGEEGRNLYTIYYSTHYVDGESRDYLFSFHYYPQSGVIQFKNQENFHWIKTP